MTPKQAYEARKAERLARRHDETWKASTAAERDTEMQDMLDRFVTAIERIADALEPKP